MYFFSQLTNSNVLGKLSIRDSNNREIAIGRFGKNTIHTWRWRHQYIDNRSYIVILMSFSAISPSIGHGLHYQSFCGHRSNFASVNLLNVFYVNLSVYPHQAGWKVSLTTVGIEPATFGILVQWQLMLCQLSYEAPSLFECVVFRN